MTEGIMERLLYVVITVFVSVCCVYAQDPRVTTQLGEIVGKEITIPYDVLPYRNVHEYLGIPFAEPPVGYRRFRKPEPKTTLESPFYAQSHGPICPQNSFFGEAGNEQQSEDCLFLNIYVPDRPADTPSGHAVMIWVYGGGFVEGASDLYDGALMAIAGNVIVVTINYRVGALGFLSTGSDSSRGNYGLWDQQLAFQWVHDNIGDFGGDNQRVTIAGESAGAMSTVQHALIPENYGLFQRIIAQSGTMSNPLIDLERDGMKDTLALARQLGCPTSTDELMSCLRGKDVDEYLSALKDLDMDVTFGPVVDGDLIKINARRISKMSENRNLEEVEFFRSLDILTGFNAYEGAFMLPVIIDPTQLESIQPTRQEMRERYLPSMLNLVYRKEFENELFSLIEAQYTNWTNPDHYDSIRLQLTKLGGDTSFAVPAIETAHLHKLSSASRNFMYFFAPKPSVRALPTPTWVPGANHGDEILFVFGDVETLGVGSDNAWEIDLLTTVVTYWTNFIKSGDPNSPEPIAPYWPEYTVETGDYIELGKSMSQDSAKQHLYAEETNFWLQVFPDLVEAMERKGGDGGCGDHTSAAPTNSVSKAVAVVSFLVVVLVTLV